MGGNIKVELAEKFVPKKMRERGGGGGGGGRGIKDKQQVLFAFQRFYSQVSVLREWTEGEGPS